MPRKPLPRTSVVQPLDTSYRFIPLTQGKFALVDVWLYAFLSQWLWYARKCTSNGKYYAVRNDYDESGKRITVCMHRVVLGLALGDPREGDHREAKETLDNRESNLRIATDTENARNKSLSRSRIGEFKGASWNKSHGKWGAQICVDRKIICLGYYATKEAAHSAYCEAAHRLHGEFARIK